MNFKIFWSFIAQGYLLDQLRVFILIKSKMMSRVSAFQRITLLTHKKSLVDYSWCVANKEDSNYAEQYFGRLWIFAAQTSIHVM